MMQWRRIRVASCAGMKPILARAAASRSRGPPGLGALGRALSSPSDPQNPNNNSHKTPSLSLTNPPTPENQGRSADSTLPVEATTARPILQPLYVHPLSQMVLLYLQEHCHQWICFHQLDRRLILHRDGTFLLQFPSPAITHTSGSLSHDNKKNGVVEDSSSSRRPEHSPDENHGHVTQKSDLGPDPALPPTPVPLTMTSPESPPLPLPSSGPTADAPAAPPSRLWTYYDTTEKKHWLSVSYHSLQERYLLQDNLRPAWPSHGRRSSVPERVHQTLQHLMKAVNDVHTHQLLTTTSRSSPSSPIP